MKSVPTLLISSLKSLANSLAPYLKGPKKASFISTLSKFPNWMFISFISLTNFSISSVNPVPAACIAFNFLNDSVKLSFTRFDSFTVSLNKSFFVNLRNSSPPLRKLTSLNLPSLMFNSFIMSFTCIISSWKLVVDETIVSKVVFAVVKSVINLLSNCIPALFLILSSEISSFFVMIKSCVFLFIGV